MGSDHQIWGLRILQVTSQESLSNSNAKIPLSKGESLRSRHNLNAKGENNMNNQFKELGNNGEKYGYTIEVFVTHEQAEHLELLANLVRTTPACIIHQAIATQIEWERKLGEILKLSEEE